ncbi:AMP-binding protein [Nocardia pseudobrasiliensis]|nr:AMP-binding protein [Nocardia pseudobrasiliensis]
MKLGRLDELITDRARECPDRIAVVDSTRSLTYSELDREIDECAVAFARVGIGPGTRVGLISTKNIATVTAIYALLRRRAVVAPIDPAEPPERIQRMARSGLLATLIFDARAKKTVVAAAERLTPDRIPEQPQQVWPSLFAAPTVPEFDGPIPGGEQLRDVGYILFTSGSTGWPKGVALTHENVLHFARWAAHRLGVRADDVVGSQASLGFDLTTFDLFSTALAGATVSLLPDFLRSFPRDVLDWLRRDRVSILYAAPSLYVRLLERAGLDGEQADRLRVLAYAGEPFPARALYRLRTAFASAQIWNLFGPTETNVCAAYRIPAGWTAEDPVPIGKPIDGTWIEVIDDAGHPSSTGQLAVSGPSVFPGYLADGRFRDPTVFIECRDGITRRCYPTGDHGGFDADGNLYFTGRRDHQIKRRGVRIDLADIEAAVADFPAVDACAAVFLDTADGGHITLFVGGRGLEPPAVDSVIAAVLPPRSAPDDVVILDELPRNIRGKIDRQQLTASIRMNSGDGL